jgi:hypothetical protein
MERRPIDQIARTARISRADCPDWMLRRQRLERLASLIEAMEKPVRLFITMECYPKHERRALRHDGSPLTIALQDPLFRQEGLAGDRVEDGITFFRLSLREAHALLCDCGYGGVMRMGASLNSLVAARARRLAARRSFAEWRDRLAAWL